MGIDVVLIGVLLFLASVFILAGLFLRQYGIIIFGSLLLALCGLLIMNGVDYVSGYDINKLNDTKTIALSTYSTYTGIFRYPIGFALVFSAVGFVIFALFDRKSRKDDDIEEVLEVNE